MNVSLDMRELDVVRRRLAVLADPPVDRLLEQLGADLESSTRERLSVTKTDPSGAPWQAWSPDYAARRPTKGGILELTGQLVDTIAWELGDGGVNVGSEMVYAMTHQKGDLDRGIPERKFLGISAEDQETLEATAVAWLDRLLEGLAS